MCEIIEGQQLEVDNLLSYRGKILQSELSQILLEMKNYVEEQGVSVNGNPITATFGVINEDGQMKIEIEALVPVEAGVIGNSKFCFKSKLKIVNAVVVKHVGDPGKLQISCDELNQYIIKNNLIPITVGYNVTKNVNMMNLKDTEIDVYVGINPNIL